MKEKQNLPKSSKIQQGLVKFSKSWEKAYRAKPRKEVSYEESVRGSERQCSESIEEQVNGS